MKKSLLISAAALLIAGPAFAQGMQGKEGAQAPERGPAAQQSAPAEKVAPPAATGQGQPRSAPDATQVPIGSSRAQDTKGAKPETTGQGEKAASSANPQARDSTPSPAGAKPETTGQGEKAAPSANPQVRDSTPSPADRSQTTTGQGAASTSSSLTGEQRTKISASIKQQHVAPVTNVNFSIAIGTAIPRDVRRMPLPVTVIEVYPAWRGYEFILVGNEILIIDPATLRIVAILEA